MEYVYYVEFGVCVVCVAMCVCDFIFGWEAVSIHTDGNDVKCDLIVDMRLYTSRLYTKFVCVHMCGYESV